MSKKRKFVFTREHKAFTNDIINSFGYIFVKTSKSKVIDLAEKKNFDTAERGRVDGMVMSSAFELERVKRGWN